MRGRVPKATVAHGSGIGQSMGNRRAPQGVMEAAQSPGHFAKWTGWAFEIDTLGREAQGQSRV